MFNLFTKSNKQNIVTYLEQLSKSIFSCGTIYITLKHPWAKVNNVFYLKLWVKYFTTAINLDYLWYKKNHLFSSQGVYFIYTSVGFCEK